MFKSQFLKFVGLLFITSVLASCGSKEEGGKARITMKMPEKMASQKLNSTVGTLDRSEARSQAPGGVAILSDIWAPSFAPQNTAELNCFGVIIGGPEEDGLATNFCEKTEGGDINFSIKKLGLAFGEEVKGLEVDSGSAREIRILAWKAENEAACQTLVDGTNVEARQLSHPFIIATDIRDLDPGDQDIVINASLTDAKEIVNCDVFEAKPGSLSTRTFTISGNVIGNKDFDIPGNNLQVSLNGGAPEEIGGDGPGTLANLLGDGVDFNVEIVQQPAGKNCSVENGTGTINGENIENVLIECVDVPFTIGGNVNGFVDFGETSIILGHVLANQEDQGSDVEVVVDEESNNRPPLDGGGPDFLSVTANGAFTFNRTRLHNDFIEIFISQQPLGQTCTLSLNGAGSGSSVFTVINDSNVGGLEVNCVTNTFTVGGTLSGLIEGRSITLENQAYTEELGQGEQITLTENNTFNFSELLPFNDNYTVSIINQPIGQTCALENETGIVQGQVTDINVICVPDTFTIGGTITGLISGRTMFMNLNTNTFSQNKGFTANGSYTFESKVASGQSFTSTITSQPPGQTCTLTGGAGTPVDQDILNLSVVCVAQEFTIGGTITGLLPGRQMFMNLNTNTFSQNKGFTANGSYTFESKVASGQSFTSTITSQPPGQTCTLTGGAGTPVDQDILNLSVVCVANSFLVGGTISGIVGEDTIDIEIVEKDTANNVLNTIDILALGNATFPGASVTSGNTYNVNVTRQPVGHTCSVTNGVGTVIGSNITDVAVTCTPDTFQLGGSLAGLISGRSVVLQNNAGDDLTLSANGSFNFATEVAFNDDYAVTVLTQPAGQTCTVTNGSGTMAAAAVTNISVDCVAEQFTIGGNISGVAAGTVEFTISTDGEEFQTINLGNGSFTSNPIDSGSAFTFALVGDGAPGHLCGFQNASGTVFDSNITNINVICSPQSFTIGGTVVGHPGNETDFLTIQNNAGDDQDIFFNGSFTMATAVASGQTFDLQVTAQPANFTCTISGGSGTVVDQNITTPVVTCIEDTFTIGGDINNLANGESITLELNELNSTTATGIGLTTQQFSFSTQLTSGSAYDVQITAQPNSQTCSITNGAGTVAGANIADVTVDCVDNPPIAVGTIDASFAGGSGQITVNSTGGDLLPQIEISTLETLNVTFQSFGNRLSACRFNSDGSFDTSWNGGSCQQFLDLAGETGIVPNALALDANDQMLIAGSVTGTSTKMFVAKLLSDGSALDTSFDTNGIQNQAGICSTNTPFTDEASAIAIDANTGNIYAAGSSLQNGGTEGLTWLALDSAGALNTTFSSSAQFSGGACIDDNTSSIENIQAMTFDNAGKLLTTSRFNGDLRITRQFAESAPPSSAALDNSFGGDGHVDINVAASFSPTNSGLSIANDIIVDSNNRIYIAGIALGSQDGYIIRLLNDGSFDTSFGTGGFVQFNRGGTDQIHKILIDAAGNIVAAGDGASGGFVARFTAAGALDTTFNAAGANGFPGIVEQAGHVFKDMVIDSAGNIYVVSEDGGNSPASMAVIKIN